MSDRPSEFELIAKLFAPLSGEGGLNLTDDAAVVPPRAGFDLIVTTDALVEGVHFLPDDPPDTVARKALRVNLSDLAAKGAEPHGYLLALSLPKRIDGDWLNAFARGLAEDQKTFGIALLGGDTTSTPGPLTLSVTALGFTPTGAMLRRAGARPGDIVFVSGTIGDAGAGLEVLQSGGADSYLVSRYRLPTPRLPLGLLLRGVASAALDVSDGLIADLGHIAEVSGVGIVVDAGAIPLSPALMAWWGDDEASCVRAATSGDDYEIAFTAPSEDAALKAAALAGVPVVRLGRVEAGRGVTLNGRDGAIAVPRAGFSHF